MFEGMSDLVQREEKVSARGQMLVEGVVQIPEGQEIITALASVGTVSCEVMNGEGDINGSAVFHLLCQGEETVCMHTSVPFRYQLQIPGAKGRSTAAARVILSDVRAENAGGEVHLSALAEITAEMPERIEVRCMTDAAGDSIEVMSKEIETQMTAGSGSARTSVNGEIDLSRLRMARVNRVLLSAAQVEIKDSYCSQDRIMVAGEVVMKLLLSCEDEVEPFAEIEERMDFSQAIDALGVDPECSCSVDSRAEEIFTEIREGMEDQPDIISCEVVLNTRVRANKSRKQTVLTDLYSTRREMVCEYEHLQLSKAEKFAAHASLKLAAPIQAGMPPIAKVLYCEAQPLIAEVQGENGFVTVDGVMDAVIIYRGAGTGLCAYRSELPFTCRLEVPGVQADSDCDVLAKVVQKSAVITAADETELRISMAFEVAAANPMPMDVLVHAEEGEEYGQRSAICIYTVQEGDTLWSVAKHLGVTCDELRAFNGIEDEVAVGSKVLVYRQIKE